MASKLPVQGEHTKMTQAEIDETYGTLAAEHNEYLAKYGVKMPPKNTTKALWLIYLRKYKGMMVHKDTISTFVSSVLPNAGKDQQVRHLAADGWNVLNRGDEIPDTEEVVPAGYHLLLTTHSPKPTYLFKEYKRAGRISAKNFEQLKAVYDNRCATCGSKQGSPNFLEPDKKTTLQQGHMDPFKPLNLENAIPQCQVCNQVYQDDYVFDEKGRTISVASANPILKAHESVKQQILDALSN